MSVSFTRCSACGEKTHTIAFELVCTSCGTVNHADYISYDVDFTTNEEITAPYKKQVNVTSIELEKIAEALGIVDSVTNTALELFTDVTETIKCKGLHRQMLMYAALYMSQRINGSAHKSKGEFGRLLTGATQAHFVRACNEMDEFINEAPRGRWDVLKSKMPWPITRFFVDSVGKIMQDMGIDSRDDRIRVRQMGSALCEKVQVYVLRGGALLEGVKDANIAIAVVFAASKMCKIKGVSLIDVGASEATVKRVVRLVHKIVVAKAKAKAQA